MYIAVQHDFCIWWCSCRVVKQYHDGYH